MRAREPYGLPEDKQRLRRRAVRLEWVTIGFMISIVTLLYFVLGSSQAMKTAWFEDILSLVPPIAFLTAVHFEKRAPNLRFPFGYYRVVSIAFLCASIALFAMGGYLLWDSVMKLLKMEHPTIGTMVLFGEQVWQGWVMVGALIYSVIPPIILGRMKLPLAEQLHDKVLHADAAMNRADWLTGLAAAVGVIGIGFGFWWADAVAAAVISLDVLHDGWTHLKQVVLDLMDHAPTTVSSQEIEPLPDRLREALMHLDWVNEADVRLREEGHLLTGEAFVVPNTEEHLVTRMNQARRELMLTDWRLYDLYIIPVHSLEQQGVRRGTD